MCYLARKLKFCANLHLCLLELMLLNQKNEATRFCFGIDTVCGAHVNYAENILSENIKRLRSGWLYV